MMISRPNTYTLAAGSGEAGEELTAFDAALLAAGIGNLNLLRVSSILPPGATYREKLLIPAGSLLPVAYGSYSSSTPGDLIAAAVGVGIQDSDTFGVIMECSGRGEKLLYEERIRDMIAEAFHRRGMHLCEVKVMGIEWRVKKVGAVIAAIPLWYV